MLIGVKRILHDVSMSISKDTRRVAVRYVLGNVVTRNLTLWHSWCIDKHGQHHKVLQACFHVFIGQCMELVDLDAEIFNDHASEGMPASVLHLHHPCQGLLNSSHAVMLVTPNTFPCRTHVGVPQASWQH